MTRKAYLCSVPQVHPFHFDTTSNKRNFDPLGPSRLLTADTDDKER